MKRKKCIKTKQGIILIPHAIKRAKERLGIGESALRRVSVKAYETGRGFYDKTLSDDLKRFIIKKYNNHKDGHSKIRVMIYGEGVYCYKNKVLKTVYKLPKGVNVSEL